MQSSTIYCTASELEYFSTTENMKIILQHYIEIETKFLSIIQKIKLDFYCCTQSKIAEENAISLSKINKSDSGHFSI